jgi:excisionase family DNA binding protein
LTDRNIMQKSKPITGTKHLEQLTFLTLDQVAELYQVSAEHIRRKVRSGEIPGVEKVLGVFRVRTAVLLGASDA